jgi:polar amino acid transport system substrate-binding protein
MSDGVYPSTRPVRSPRRHRLPRLTRVLSCVALPLLATVSATGCARPDTEPEPINTAAIVPRPPGVEVPAAIPSGSPGPACNPRASLRPRGPLPPPGAMPENTPMATIAKRGRLIVGVSQTAYLLGFRDPISGKIVGFDIDLAREIAQAIFGNRDSIQFKVMTSAERITAIRSGAVDIVVSAMTITCDRLQQVAFSTEYLKGGHRVLVNRSSGYRSIDDLGGRRVCASKGSTPLLSIARANSHPIPVGADTVADCLLMLQQGQVDAVCTDNYILAGLAAQDPTTEVVGPPFSDEPYGVAMSRDAPELVRFVNAVLERVRSSGAWAALFERWFGELGRLGPTPPPPQPLYLD